MKHYIRNYGGFSCACRVSFQTGVSSSSVKMGAWWICRIWGWML